ncbi:MAG: glutaredoxin family protein [Anaerolineae bacterium]|nr:glutaredoxin family protein [Anaerolineae bacterium]
MAERVIALKKKIKLYALSTCGWCKKTKKFLDDNYVEYEYEYVDLLTGAERERVMTEVDRWNPRRSFPTIVIDDSQVIIGYNEDRLREALEL